LNLALTSDLPSTPNQTVFEYMRRCGNQPRIAWIPPVSASGHQRFASAREQFGSYGFPTLEFIDIDENPNEARLARLGDYEVVYFAGGDPLVFRDRILRLGLAARLRAYAGSGGLIVAASGGAMQFGRNVSPYRLLGATLDDVVAAHGAHDALGFVDYELLPHLNRHEPAFLEIVRRYSERVPHDVIALDDGSAMLHVDDEWQCVGDASRFRVGVRSSVGPTA
jgi:peptidase E